MIALKLDWTLLIGLWLALVIFEVVGLVDVDAM